MRFFVEFIDGVEAEARRKGWRLVLSSGDGGSAVCPPKRTNLSELFLFSICCFCLWSSVEKRVESLL